MNWRKSSFSTGGINGGGDCVQVAPLPGPRTALRNSNHPAAGTLLLAGPELAAWFAGIKRGEYDDLG